MAPTKPIQMRFSPFHRRILRKLMAKLGLDQSNVLRVALMRPAEQVISTSTDARERH
jgi:hypothetical protein